MWKTYLNLLKNWTPRLLGCTKNSWTLNSCSFVTTTHFHDRICWDSLTQVLPATQGVLEAHLELYSARSICTGFLDLWKYNSVIHFLPFLIKYIWWYIFVRTVLNTSLIHQIDILYRFIPNNSSWISSLPLHIARNLKNKG